MGIKSRTDLKGMFMNGTRPSQKEFANLIDSMLNKKDDRFFGHWRPGIAYQTGDVVIYNNALWTVPPDPDGNDQEICSRIPPGENQDWDSLIVSFSDNDWEADEDTGVMFAKVFQCIGIGQRFTESGLVPEAKVDISEEDKARYLILPKPLEAPTLSLFQLGEGPDKTYFLSGLDNTQVGFTSDVPTGFIFRKGFYCEPGEEASLDFRDGDVLMVVQPASDGLARVGISTASPQAMLDITDQTKGQFLFNPEDKEDPAFTIVNLDPETDKNYLAMGVGAEWAPLVTDAPKGFVFRHGEDYGEFCAHEEVNQGKSLMVIRYNEEDQPRVGIGTEEPCAMLDITDQQQGQFILSPEDGDDPLFLAINLKPEESPHYLATGITTERSEWMTDSPSGFAFKAGDSYDDPCKETSLADGQSLVVILPPGNVGVGTEEPEVRMEVTDNRETGQFLFNLDDKKVNPALAIVNTRPGEHNYLTLGTSDQTSIFITNSPNGFSFRFGGPAGQNDNEVDIDQNSETLFRVRPQRDSGGTPLPREMRIFPEATGDLPAIVEIKGKVGIYRTPRNFEMDTNGTTRSFGYYINTDSQKMDEVNDLPDVLEKVIKLKPKTFKWSNATGHQAEGKQIGLFAHEVEQDFPEVVKETPPDPVEDQTKSVAYQNLVPVLIKAIKELNDKVDAQTAEIDALKERIEQLEGGA